MEPDPDRLKDEPKAERQTDQLPKALPNNSHMHLHHGCHHVPGLHISQGIRESSCQPRILHPLCVWWCHNLIPVSFLTLYVSI